MIGCVECVPCAADHCDATAYCLSQPGTHPCPHDGAWCENHSLEECADCRLEAEMNMYATGDYSPRADPFYRPEAKDADDAYWADTAKTPSWDTFHYPPEDEHA